MIFTLLLDLDDTLLNTHINQFEKAYIDSLSQYLAPYIEPGKMVKELLAATHQMILNDQPELTLEMVFDAAFYPKLNLNKNNLQSAITRFYEEVFPKLKVVTTPKPDAVRFIDWAVVKGHHLVVATNPLFPRTAILQRLSWAGFHEPRLPFELITSYENFHFAKPNPSYYAEIAATIGWPDEPIMMIGNDLQDDILPAASLGMRTFWLQSNETKQTMQPPEIPSGDYNDLVACIEKPGNSNQTQVNLSSKAVLSILTAHLGFLNSLANTFLGNDSATIENTLRELNLTLARWIDQERNEVQPTIRHVLATSAVDQVSSGSLMDAPVMEINSSEECKPLEEFCRLRQSTISQLTNLPQATWKREFIIDGIANSLYSFVKRVLEDEKGSIRGLVDPVRSTYAG
jgi:FMN phosphatase YigB (HAD superfamily)